MYEMYNKDGSFRCYRIQRTVKDLNNNKKKIYAYSKTSLKDCKIKMNKMLAANQLAHKEKQKRLESKYNFDQYALNYYKLYIKNANLSITDDERRMILETNLVYVNLTKY